MLAWHQRFGVRILNTNPAKDAPTGADFDLQQLSTLFSANGDPALFSQVEVTPATVPAPYRELLVHQHHMTVTVESHYGGPVDVKVLAQFQSGESYARQVLLAVRDTGHIVQYGVMRINLGFCDPDVRAAILAGDTPLGRVLIAHNVMRRIEPQCYLQVTPGPKMMEWFDLQTSTPTYGRLALIHCNGKPAVELLEIVAPATTDTRK